MEEVEDINLFTNYLSHIILSHHGDCFNNYVKTHTHTHMYIIYFTKVTEALNAISFLFQQKMDVWIKGNLDYISDHQNS